MSKLRRSLTAGRGATATETLILMVLVAMVILASIKVLRDTLGDKVNSANDSVAEVSMESAAERDQRRLRENAKKNAAGGAQSGQASAGGAGEGSAAAGSSGAGASGAGPSPSGGAAAATAQPGAAQAEPESGCGGFNPFIIPIALGLAGLLGYVVLKSKKG